MTVGASSTTVVEVTKTTETTTISTESTAISRKRKRATLNGRFVHSNGGDPVNRVLKLIFNGMWQATPVEINTNSEGEFYLAEEQISNSRGKSLHLRVSFLPWENIKTAEYREILSTYLMVPPVGQEVSYELKLDFFEYQDEFARLDLKDKKISFYQKPPAALEEQFFEKVTKYILPPTVELGFRKVSSAIESVALFRMIADFFNAAHSQNEAENRLEFAAWLQKFFTDRLGDNLTIQKEKEKSGSSRTPEFQGQRIFEGGAQIPLRKVFDRNGNVVPNQFKEIVNLARFEQDGEYTALVWSTAYYVLVDGKMVQTRIEILKRKMLDKPLRALIEREENDPEIVEKIISANSTDADYFDYSRFHRMAVSVHWQLFGHLGQCHVSMEAVNMAISRTCSHTNPVMMIGMPFLRDILWINQLAANDIFGPEGGLTVASNLTLNGVKAGIRESLSSLDPLTFKPRTPISEHDLYGHVAHAVWKFINTYLKEKWGRWENDRWIKGEQHNALVQHWSEIRNFSRDLTEHSQPFYPREGIKNPKEVFVDQSEIPDPTRERSKVNGVEKAIDYIVCSESEVFKDGDKSCEESLNRLVQVMTFAIFITTFYHSWKHNKQPEDLGEILYQTMCLDNGGIGKSADGSVLPQSTHMVKEKSIVWVLGALVIGYIVKNENGDIPRDFVDRFKQLSEEVKAVYPNFDLAKFTRSQINS